VHRYIADNISGSDGDSVSNWSDEGGGNDLFQGMGSKQPILKTGSNGINGKNVVRFDGTDDLLTTGTSGYTTISEPYTFFVVFEYLDSASNTRILDGGSSTQNLFGIRTSPNEWLIRQGNNVQGGIPDTNKHIATIRYDSGSGDILRIDGTQVVSGNAGERNNNGITVGADAGNSNHANVDVAEIIEYEDALSTLERDQIENYFSSEYGITI